MLSPPLYARPEIIRDSSAPRRQLDGGVPPAADGRGGGQTRPWRRGCPRRPCCRAVLVVARPDGVCPEERPAGIGRSGVVAVVDPASRHATASVAGVQQAASTHPVSASGIRLSSRPVSGHLGVVVQRSGGRTAAVQLSGVQLSGVHPCGVQPSGVCPCRSACVRLLPLRRWRGGPGQGGHRDGWRPCGCRAVDGSIDGRGGRDAGAAAEVALVKGGRWRPGPPGWVRAAAAALTRRATRQARPACGAPVAAGCAVGTRGRLQREVAAAAAWLPPSGWVHDHGGWSSPRLTAGWAAPEGPGEVPTGMGVRPHRGPSQQRALPARCRQRSDLRR
jgi:hypothetical protein